MQSPVLLGHTKRALTAFTLLSTLERLVKDSMYLTNEQFTCRMLDMLHWQLRLQDCSEEANVIASSLFAVRKSLAENGSEF